MPRGRQTMWRQLCIGQQHVHLQTRWERCAEVGGVGSSRCCQSWPWPELCASALPQTNMHQPSHAAVQR